MLPLILVVLGIAMNLPAWCYKTDLNRIKYTSQEKLFLVMMYIGVIMIFVGVILAIIDYWV